MQRASLRFSGAADPARLKPGQLNNVGTVRKWHARYGDDRTWAVLSSLSRAFEGEVLKIAGPLFTGTAAVVIEHGQQLSHHLFVDVLQRPQDEWITDFRRRSAEDGVGVVAAASMVLREAYAEAVAE